MSRCPGNPPVAVKRMRRRHSRIRNMEWLEQQVMFLRATKVERSSASWGVGGPGDGGGWRQALLEKKSSQPAAGGEESLQFDSSGMVNHSTTSRENRLGRVMNQLALGKENLVFGRHKNTFSQWLPVVSDHAESFGFICSDFQFHLWNFSNTPLWQI